MGEGLLRKIDWGLYRVPGVGDMRESGDQQRLERNFDVLRQKLLDLSLRNPMLNFKHSPRSKGFLQIVNTNLDATYNALVEAERALRIDFLKDPEDIPKDEKTKEFRDALAHARVSDVEYQIALVSLENTGRNDEHEIAKVERELRDRVRTKLDLPPRPDRKTMNPTDRARELGIDPSYDLKTNVKAEDLKSLQTLKWNDILEATLERVSGAARLSEQEAGLSTLFLAFGFLEWHDAQSDRTCFAPILLLPVSLSRKRDKRGKINFDLSTQAEAAETNLSLQKKFEQEFSVKFDEFDPPEDSQNAIERYLKKIEKAVADYPSYKVRRWLTLANFAFGRSAMYADLDPNKWKERPTSQRLVGSILRGFDDSEPVKMGTPPEYEIDDPRVETIAPILIQDADSSQHSALIDVMKGADLVVQGPPGTGKSQTITNIIANALFAGKTILFIAEKQAALDVVKRRLERSGLGSFCLELHSNKASSKTAIDQLRDRFNLRFRGTGETNNEAVRKRSRDALIQYFDAINRRPETAISPFSAIWRGLRERSKWGDTVLQKLARQQVLKQVNTDDEAFLELLHKVRIWCDLSESFTSSFGPVNKSPWHVAWSDRNKPVNRSQLLDRLDDAAKLAADVVTFIKLAKSIGLPDNEPFHLAAKAHAALSDKAPDGAILLRLRAADRRLLKQYFEKASQLFALQDEAQRLGRAIISEQNIIDSAKQLCSVVTNLKYQSLSPLKIFAAASKELEDARSVQRWAANSAIALEVLGLDKTFPCEGVASLWKVLVAVKKAGIPSETFRFINLPAEILPELEEAEDERRSLTEDEREWRGRFPTIGRNPWPRIDDLESLAGCLRLSAVGRALKIRGPLRNEVQSTAARLGIAIADKNKTAAVQNLIRHCERSSQYFGSRGLHDLAGSYWHGLSTPFSDMMRGIRIREHFAKALQRLPSGDTILRAFCALTAQQFQALTDFKLPEIAQLDAKQLSEISKLTIGSALSLAEQKQNEVSGILSALESAPLKECDYAISDLRRIADLSSQHIVQSKELLRSELGRTIPVGNAEELYRLRGALVWAETVEQLALPKETTVRLESLSPQATRDALRDIAVTGLPKTSQLTEFVDRVLADNNVGLDRQNIVESAHTLLNKKAELIDFAAITQARCDLAQSGLGQLLAMAEQDGIPESDIEALISAVVAVDVAHKAIESEPVLSSSTSARNDAARKNFIRYDKEKLSYDRQQLCKKLLKNEPPVGSNIGNKKTWTDLQLLQNEFGKSQRFLPLRTILSNAAPAIQALTPCIMMSPLSLAKFLPSDRVSFDLLVIDEASQMRPEDALGAMLRSKQIVVVGDQKQLPPTDFFNRGANTDVTDEDEELIDDVKDNESILEITGKTFKASRQLRWHYRSRCESLIAFSNKHFYEDKLITFPSSKPGSFSVELIRVNGNYHGRINEREAQTVAEKAVKFMREHANLKGDELPTLGVVALNSDQRDLIAEEIQQLSSDDELVDKYRLAVEAKGEDFFVKNLENVQGDERDYILISLTYGPAPGQSNVLQRFGPINSKAGHRRLNVLFSRARQRIVLFSSMGSSDVLTSETSNEGRLALKNYLEYAEAGGKGSYERVGAETDSDFEAEVADRLRAKGFEVDTQIGVSGFRIDLGVKDKANPGHYLVGIECDGATYHSSKSARDRDRLRQEVLEGLGWKILRVWSTDWFENADVMTDRLVKEIQSVTRRSPDVVDFRFGDLPAENTPNKTVDSPQAPVFDETLLSGDAPISTSEAISLLIKLRNGRLAREVKGYESQKSILRDDVIEFLVRNQFSSPDDWDRKVPQFLTARTNPKEKTYLPIICSVLTRISDRLESVPIKEIIGAGEGSETEFKSTLRTNLHTNQFDQGREKDVLKAIGAFLNTRGGYLIIGVADDGTLVGNDADKFPNEDKMRLHLKNLIAERIGAAHMMFVDMKHVNYQQGRILVVSCRKARTAVFVKDGNVERFYIRTDSASTELAGEKMLSYIASHMNSAASLEN